MKKILFLYLLLTIAQGSKAQFTIIADGPEFKEPEKGAAKVLQLKNGNTVYLHFRDGIALQLYNAGHQLIQDKNIPTSHVQQINAVFETQGNIVVFASERVEKHPVLYRLILDGKDGSLKKEEKVRYLDKLQLSAVTSDFKVVKDPYSECYAVKTWLNEESGSEIIHYSPDHRELNHVTFDKQTGDQFFHGFRDMAVLGDKAVCVLADNFHASNRTELLTLENGSNTFKATALTGTGKGAIVKYNPHTDQLIILQGTKLSLLNGATKVVEQVKEISKYKGAPQNILIGEDGSFRIVLEEIETFSQQPVPYTVTQPKHTILGNLTIIQFDKKGMETDHWVLRKKHGIRGKLFEPFYQKYAENNATILQEGEQFLYPDVAGDHILINEATDRHRKTVWLVSNCSGFYYTLKNGGTLSAPKHVFPVNNLGLFIGTDYDPQSKTYATLNLSTVKGNKKIKLTWLRVE